MGFYWFSETQSKVSLRCYWLVFLQYKDFHSTGMILKGTSLRYDQMIALILRKQDSTTNRQTSKQIKPQKASPQAKLSTESVTFPRTEPNPLVSIKILYQDFCPRCLCFSLLRGLGQAGSPSPCCIGILILSTGVQSILKRSAPSLLWHWPLSGFSSDTTAPPSFSGALSYMLYRTLLWALLFLPCSWISVSAQEHSGSHPVSTALLSSRSRISIAL